jgi:hypothetical protein
LGVAEDTGGRGGQTGGSRQGLGVPGQSFPPVPDLQPSFDAPGPLEDRRGYFRFGPGFELASDDREFILQFHDLTQFDYRGELNAGNFSMPLTASAAFSYAVGIFNGNINGNYANQNGKFISSFVNCHPFG